MLEVRPRDDDEARVRARARIVCLMQAKVQLVGETCMGAGCDESGVTASLSRQGINNMSQRGAITGDYRAEGRAN